ncbi:hypothetical protein [Lactococcus petauri]|uniref:hypothetical protein n=1 Tax=Lactococcus petauri TaxID=1940789 RepID=UPI0018AAD4E2|nr:hypothetical protein [Lactococcus petauri]
MTITNYTFFSPNGTEFPVSSNADAKLYLMLSGMTLIDYKRTDWTDPVDTALNRQYTNTSIVAAGRYFELTDESVVLSPSSTNYVHANIDLANAMNPVSLSVETADNSNGNDINTSSGVFKKCFDIIQTNGASVISSSTPLQNVTFGNVNASEVKGTSVVWKNNTAPAIINGAGAPSGKITYERNNGTVYVSGAGNWGTLTAGVTKTVATLPAGFRPEVDKEISGNAMGGTDSNSWKVKANGEVAVTNRPGGQNRYSGWSVSYPYYE